jgi:hypothetical protein
VIAPPASTIEQTVGLAERVAVEALHLRPVVLAPRLAHATGAWKDAPATIATRLFAGDAATWFRVAVIRGVQLEIGNIAALPRPNRGVAPLEVALVWRAARGEGSIGWSTVAAEQAPRRIVRADEFRSALTDTQHAIREWVMALARAAPRALRSHPPRAAHERQLTVRRADPDTRDLLGTLFGRTWTDEYIRSALYPES